MALPAEPELPVVVELDPLLPAVPPPSLAGCCSPLDSLEPPQAEPISTAAAILRAR
jgi:hypothetical protein